MDERRAELIRHIQAALAAARAYDDVMTEYLLEMALQEALGPEREAIGRARKSIVPRIRPRH